MKLGQIPPIENKLVNAIIETPRGNQNKFNYDPGLDLFRLKKTLPMGMAFPLDFGFIPNTIAEDGDPLDIMAFMDQRAYPGCLVQCRIIGIIEAMQKEKNGKQIRNDRVIGVADCSILYADLTDIKDLNKQMVKEIQTFFENYNKNEGKEFKLLHWRSAEKAIEAIKKHTILKE
ncbi:MAG: ipyR [Flavipsychrobacter sp.]|jgi:inorganic pyrophosphatase|nr:ipyR [Flavipsychrobacter sp.]